MLTDIDQSFDLLFNEFNKFSVLRKFIGQFLLWSIMVKNNFDLATYCNNWIFKGQFCFQSIFSFDLQKSNYFKGLIYRSKVSTPYVRLIDRSRTVTPTMVLNRK